jgi:protein regulator of cytokinesis 1
MRDLVAVPELDTPVNPYKGAGLSGGGSIVRNVEPEDVYDDRPKRHTRSNSNLSHHSQYSSHHHDHQLQLQQQHHYQQHQAQAAARQAQPTTYPMAPPPTRQISNTSSHASTTVSGSENWETYDDNSESEQDASDTHYAKARAAVHHGNPQQAPRGGAKRYEPESGHRPHASQAKRHRGFPPPTPHNPGHHHGMVDHDGNRIVSGGGDWTDEEVF